MADPLSISASVIALVTFAVASSTNLYATIRAFRSQDKRLRALKSELGDLNDVLKALLETVNNNPDLDFEALKPPLHRCGNACKEYGDLIARFAERPTSSGSTIRHWITEKYLQGDITDFKAMLAGYKSTINIALANANIRVAAVTPRVVEDYKDMISDTTHDLREQLQSIEAKIESLAKKGSDNDGSEWQAMLEEKNSIQRGLEICDHLSSQIEQLEPTSGEHSQFQNYPSAHKFIKNGLNATRSTVRTLVSQLQTHQDDIDKRMAAMRPTSMCQPDAADLAQLQATKESIRQCIKVVSDADDALMVQRQNLFEDITLADDALNFTISTVGDLVTARRINLTGRSLNVGGQISDESYQKSIDVMSKRDTSNVLSNAQEIDQMKPTRDPVSTESEFHGRHGPGVRLSQSIEGANVTKEASQLNKAQWRG
ncbi:hypothetical protein HIM_11385 [Hirsutella minnesotensis 3608]|uniref:Azaphilone pigments biosynthesis cluster protein L N-terminal domain-containing protein n=1 Tax=Hirsutella minnesotensis 3608 TaxID=1043627 RepID=A0A0F7ZWM3_9HYPO|nr:hypothetical protein HIM_11385 [Hirsutella minnesotensis 3608]